MRHTAPDVTWPRLVPYVLLVDLLALSCLVAVRMTSRSGSKPCSDLLFSTVDGPVVPACERARR